MESEFLHCLRAQIYPDEYYQERIDSIKDFCLKYGVKNVILIFNGEEHNVGHIKDEELPPWMKVMKEAKTQLNAVGVSISLNPWMEMGHLDRGRKLQEGQNFVTMVDRNGKQSQLVACPLDETWKKYYLHQLEYYVKEIKPEVLWIEDDFRLHNHPPLDWGGCFCSLHMKEFSKRLGKEETREEFVKHLEEAIPSIERKVWLDFSFETIDGLAKEIEETVKRANPSTHVGLMSSMPSQHAMEARHWAKLHEDLSPDGIKIDRIHLPSYREEGSKKYYFDFNRISMVNRSFIGDDCLIYPELENSSFSSFVKDNKFVAFQLESAIPLGLSGMTYNIYAHCGNGVQEEFGYGERIKELTPYLNKVKELNLLPSQMKGITFPFDENTVYHTHKQGFLNLIPKDFDIVGYFSSLGYSYKVSKDKSFNNQIVFLNGQNVRNFSKDELIELFKNNYVFVDGIAASILQEYDLLYLIHAKSVEFRGQHHQYDAFEMMLNDTYDNMHHYKATSQRRNGDYYSIVYEDDVNIVSGLFDARMKLTGNGVAYTSSFFLYPYGIENSEDTSFFMPLRRFLFAKYLLPNIKNEFIYCLSDGIYPYLYKQENRYVLVLTNANYNDFDNTEFEAFNIPIKDIEMICKDGNIKKVNYKTIGNKVIIDEPLKYLSTSTFIIHC